MLANKNNILGELIGQLPGKAAEHSCPRSVAGGSIGSNVGGGGVIALGLGQ